MGDAYTRNWAGLHDSPRTAPSALAKSCTYLRWFARPCKMPAEPYFELPISLSKLRRLVQFRLGSHDLPIEQGRMARPIVPRYFRRCTLCSWHAPGDERHFMLERLHLMKFALRPLAPPRLKWSCSVGSRWTLSSHGMLTASSCQCLLHSNTWA